MEQSQGEKIFSFFNYFFMILFALATILPVLHVLQLTFSGHPDLSFRLFPRDFTLENYRYVISEGIIVRPLANSLYFACTATVISLSLTALLAYPLSFKELPGRRVGNFLVMLTMMIHLGFLPKFLLIRELGLMNSYWGIFLEGGISSFNLIILRNYFQKLPREIFDSVRMDGAGEMTILMRIALPLSKPVLATVFLFYFVSDWNEYFKIVLYISDHDKYTLQVILRSMIILDEEMGGGEMDSALVDNVKYTTVIVSLIPVMMLYPFLQKYFTKGIMLGSVKG